MKAAAQKWLDTMEDGAANKSASAEASSLPSWRSIVSAARRLRLRRLQAGS